MNFSALPVGASVFIDANVFVYAYAPDPTFGPACTDFLERIEFQQLQGFTSAHVFSEVSHRVMTLDACQSFGWPYAGIARRLRRHPAEIAKLHRFRKALDNIIAIGVRIIPVTAPNVLMAGDRCLQHGLLSGDALLVAMMQASGVTNLASNDADFDRVPGVTRFGPV